MSALGHKQTFAVQSGMLGANIADVDRIIPSRRHTTECRYFASILVTFSDALVLANQFSLLSARVLVAVPLAFVVAGSVIDFPICGNKSNCEQGKGANRYCDLSHKCSSSARGQVRT